MRVLGMLTYIAKIVVRAMVILACLWLVAALYLRGCVMGPHQQHVIDARRIFNSYNQDQWKRLFDALENLHSQNLGLKVAAEKSWPVEVQALGPYNLGYREGEFRMNWTGGFDADNLYVHVVVEAGEHERGIYVNDSKHEDGNDWYVYRPPPGTP